MHRLFEMQQAAEKRRLLDFVVSNSVWKEGKIVPAWPQPFDMIAVANQPSGGGNIGGGPKNGLNENWLRYSERDLERDIEKAQTFSEKWLSSQTPRP
jgi:hypothetical protein